MPHESRLNFSTDEILANVDTREPLIVKGVKCHGGFDADGNYRSPRTAFRVPAIEAWQEQHVATSGTALFEIPADTVSPQVPNVAQVKFLLQVGRARADGAMAVGNRDRRGLRRDDSRAAGASA